MYNNSWDYFFVIIVFYNLELLYWITRVCKTVFSIQFIVFIIIILNYSTSWYSSTSGDEFIIHIIRAISKLYFCPKSFINHNSQFNDCFKCYKVPLSFRKNRNDTLFIHFQTIKSIAFITSLPRIFLYFSSSKSSEHAARHLFFLWLPCRHSPF